MINIISVGVLKRINGHGAIIIADLRLMLYCKYLHTLLQEVFRIPPSEEY